MPPGEIENNLLLPLLSVIIPTKNGHSTILFAIDSVLEIQSANIEVVIQDCSSDNSLYGITKVKYKDDPRLKYFYSDDEPSMIENWSRAISNSSGKYLYGIGDDDAVLPEIVEVAKWIDENSINTLVSLKAQYIWKDAYLGTFGNGRLSLPANFTGNFYSIDLNYEYIRKINNCGFGYNNFLPNIYHGFVARKIFELHKKSTSFYLNGTSMDVYSAFVIPNYTDKLYYLDYPLSIFGASGKSTSNRFITNKSAVHFKEFKNYTRFNNLPNTFNAEVSITETTIQALLDLNKFDLIKTIKLSLLYSKCAVFEPKKLLSFYYDFKLNKNSSESNFDYFYYFSKFAVSSIKYRILNSFVKLSSSILPKYLPVIESLVQIKKPHCDDISLSLKYIKKYQFDQNLSIQFDKKIEFLKTPKEIWE